MPRTLRTVKTTTTCKGTWIICNNKLLTHGHRKLLHTRPTTVTQTLATKQTPHHATKNANKRQHHAATPITEQHAPCR